MTSVGEMMRVSILLLTFASVVKSNILTGLSTKFSIDYLKEKFQLAIEVGTASVKAFNRFNDAMKTMEAQTCFRDLKDLITGIKEGKPWAFQAVDSSAKPLLLDISGRSRACQFLNHVEHPFDVNFCYIEWTIKKKMKIPVGLCLPSSCSEKLVNDFRNPINEILEIATKKPGIKLRCSYEDSLSTAAKLVIAICMILIILVILSSIYDLYLQHEEYLQNGFLRFFKKTEEEYIPSHLPFQKYFLCFSAVTNGKQLLRFEYGSHEFPMMNGLRAFSIIGVIIGHTSISLFFADNAIGIQEITELLPSSILLSMFYTLNIFFLISGFLTSYNYLKLKEDGRKISWFSLILFRILRISPVFYFSLIVQWKLAAYLFPTHLNILHQYNTPNCDENWLLSLSYLQNYLSIPKQCMGQAWYLANDMQIFVACLPLLAVMQRSTKYTLFVCISLITTIMIAVYVVCEKYQIEVFFPKVFTIEKMKYGDLNGFMDKLYGQSWYRCNAYLLGMLGGLFLFKTKCQIKLTKIQITILWSTALLIIVPVMFVMNKVQFSTPISALFCNFYGTVWPLGFAAMIFLSCSNYGGVFTTIFAWKAWAPISRLTLPMLFSHILVLQWIVYQQESFFHFTIPYVLLYIFIVVKLSVFIGIILHLIVEKPFARITSLLIR